jgi:hypothetical protein
MDHFTSIINNTPGQGKGQAVEPSLAPKGYPEEARLLLETLLEVARDTIEAFTSLFRGRTDAHGYIKECIYEPVTLEQQTLLERIRFSFLFSMLKS